MNVDVYSYYGYEQYMAELEHEDVYCPHCGEKIYDGCQSVATGEWYCSDECREEADDIHYEKEMEVYYGCK